MCNIFLYGTAVNGFLADEFCWRVAADPAPDSEMQRRPGRRQEVVPPHPSFPGSGARASVQPGDERRLRCEQEDGIRGTEPSARDGSLGLRLSQV